MSIILTPGEQHESTVFKDLANSGSVKVPGKGRPKLRPKRFVGDKAYSSREIREFLRAHHVRITIPRRVNETRTGPFDRTLYKLRNKIERLINRLKQFRRVATRYEKRSENHRAMWVIASLLLWL